MVGKRDDGHTYEFVADLAIRIDGHVQISTDGWPSYPGAVMDSFDGRSSYGQIVKAFGGGDSQHRYSPAGLAGARRLGMWGMPRFRYILTSSCGASESHHANADAAIHPAHQRLLEEAEQSPGGGGPAFRPLQFLSPAFIARRRHPDCGGCPRIGGLAHRPAASNLGLESLGRVLSCHVTDGEAWAVETQRPN